MSYNPFYCYADDIVERALMHAHYFVDEMCTIRQVAEWSGWSKSIVHDDLVKRLPHINHELYEEVHILIKLNKEDGNRKGGRAVQQMKKQGR